MTHLVCRILGHRWHVQKIIIEHASAGEDNDWVAIKRECKRCKLRQWWHDKSDGSHIWVTD